MRRTEKQFQTLTAGDVMSRSMVVLPQEMSVLAAARILLEGRVSVAPVADSLGRCVGVLLAADFLRWAADDWADERNGNKAAGVWCEWQVVDEKLAQRDEVSRYMRSDPLLVTRDARLATIAEALLDPHRTAIVVDKERRPLGVVSATDLLGALASVERRAETEFPTATHAIGRLPPLRPSHRPFGLKTRQGLSAVSHSFANVRRQESEGAQP